MNELLTKALKVSETVHNSLTCSLAWSGATRFIKNFAQAGKKELDQYLTLVTLGNDTALEIKPTADDIIAVISQPPTVMIPNKAQKAHRIARGESEATIKEACNIVYHKKLASFQQDMALFKKNETEIVAALNAALDGDTPRKKLLSYTESIVHNKIYEKLTYRKAVCYDDIYRNYLADDREVEVDAIYEILDELEDLRKAKTAA